jgi:hypothetical protein
MLFVQELRLQPLSQFAKRLVRWKNAEQETEAPPQQEQELQQYQAPVISQSLETRIETFLNHALKRARTQRNRGEK